MEKNCFIICPIGLDNSDIRKQSDKVLKFIIEPVCKTAGFKAVRVDKITDTDSITKTILEHLNEAPLVITDLTNSNPNVFYETGFRSALNKPIVQIIKEDQQLPFDVSSTRTITYDLTDPEKIEITKERLLATINTLLISNDSEIMLENDSSVTVPQTPLAINPSIAPQILSMLLDIQDNISDLKISMENIDDKRTDRLISVFVNKLQEKTSSTPEDKAMEVFFGEFVKNPDKMMNLVTKIGNNPNFRKD